MYYGGIVASPLVTPSHGLFRNFAQQRGLGEQSRIRDIIRGRFEAAAAFHSGNIGTLWAPLKGQHSRIPSLAHKVSCLLFPRCSFYCRAECFQPPAWIVPHGSKITIVGTQLNAHECPLLSNTPKQRMPTIEASRGICISCCVEQHSSSESELFSQGKREQRTRRSHSTATAPRAST